MYVILTPLHPALPPYYRLKMCALLRAFTHFNQNLNSLFFLFIFFCKKKIVPKHANFTGTIWMTTVMSIYYATRRPPASLGGVVLHAHDERGSTIRMYKKRSAQCLPGELSVSELTSTDPSSALATGTDRLADFLDYLSVSDMSRTMVGEPPSIWFESRTGRIPHWTCPAASAERHK